MMKQCKTKPERLITDFFQQVFSPQESPSLLPNYYNQNTLADGLEELKTSADITALKIPCLILHGTVDQIVPVSFAHELEQSIENAELRTFDACGHALPMLHSAEITEEIKSFLKKHKINT